MTEYLPITVRDRLLRMPRRLKRLLLVCFDVCILTLALWVSYGLRIDRWTLPETFEQWLVLLSAPVVAIPIFIRMGLYRAVVRYLPERALWTIFKAMAFAAVAWVVVAFLLAMTGGGIVPRAIPIIYWALGTVLIIGSRFAAKWLFWPQGQTASLRRPSVVIYGAGEAGNQLAASLRNSHTVVAFLDDDATLHRREVAGLRVHPPSHLPVLIRDFGVQQVILSIPSLSPSRRKEIVASLGGHGVSVQSLPAINDIVTGKYLVSQIREIEIDELLGRSSVPPDTDLIREMVVGRTIMVTGAGGSIGSELCRKIAQWAPQRLILFEANEFALYRIDQELAAKKDVSVVAILGSVADDRHVRQVLCDHGVQVVFHAAAYKHVPLVEANAIEGIKNNVFGTKTLVDAAYELGIRDFVLISTDKAVRPTNVMGATKRWAELVVREKAELAHTHGTGQRFSAVRFGNVLGSNGSVVPLFKEQISHGGPVTLTDRAMTRYFMSIQEAAELIVQAGALSQGGDVFLLDMGEPILISELAENMIRLAGLSVRSPDNPEGDIEIIAVGKRPGEKMYEELFYDESSASRTHHPKILRGASAPSKAQMLQPSLEAMLKAILDANERDARRILFDVVNNSDGTNA